MKRRMALTLALSHFVGEGKKNAHPAQRSIRVFPLAHSYGRGLG